MAFKEGDFLQVDYTVWDANGSAIIATTQEKVAKENKIFNDKMKYGPALVIVGAGTTIKGLDRELRGMSANESKKFTLKPQEAFGERNEEMVRVMPLSDFREREIDPYPGMQINLDDMTAVVKSVSSGRVVVDANHPYAGKDVTYEVKVVKQLTADKDKVEAISDSYNVKPTTASVNSDKVEMFFNNAVAKNADYFVGRATTIASIFMNLKNIKAVEVKEEYLRPAEKKEKE